MLIAEIYFVNKKKKKKKRKRKRATKHVKDDISPFSNKMTKWLGLVSLFNGISTFLDYLILKSTL